MVLYFYNSLGQRKQRFVPLNRGRVGLYSCGPTVYDHTHLGHCRAYVFVDTLVRVLRLIGGYRVRWVMNITDVGHLTDDADSGEDKVEKKARKEKATVWDIAERYTNEFFEVMAALGVGEPTIVCRATQHIPQMIGMIKKIEANGFAYRIDDGIYFDTAKLSDYGKLAGMPREKLIVGARIEPNPQKKNPTDFALWKFSPKEGPKRQMEWDSPWGIGFPGWHIECSAMSTFYLGPFFDIHTGGVDHIPIHHTNEMAQTQAALGTDQAQFWLHNEFLLVEGRKMSKSLGNFLIAKKIFEKYDPRALRYLFLQTHYRKPINFTYQALESAQNALHRLRRFSLQLRLKPTIASKDYFVMGQNIKKFWDQFREYLGDDLDTADALGVVWQVVRHQNLTDKEKAIFLSAADEILGLGLFEEQEEERLPQKVLKLVERREELRRQKQFAKADEIRARLLRLGYQIEDTPEGPRVKKIKKIIL